MAAGGRGWEEGTKVRFGEGDSEGDICGAIGGGGVRVRHCTGHPLILAH